MISSQLQPKIDQNKDSIAKQLALNKARAQAILLAALRDLESKSPSISTQKEIKC